MVAFDNWLSVELLEKLAGEENRSGSGVLLLAWEGIKEIAPQERRSPQRLSRLLRATALHFAADTGDVYGWMEMPGAIVVLVRKPQVLEAGDDDTGLSRLLYALRETAVRVFSGSPLSGRFRDGDRILCGGASLLIHPGKLAGAKSGRELEQAVVAAALQSWRNATSDTSMGFDLMLAGKMDQLPFGERIGVRYAPIVSLTDGSLYGYEAVPCDRLSGEEWTPQYFYFSSEREGALYDNDRKFRELAIRGIPAGSEAARLFLPVPARIVFDPRLYPGSTLNRIEAAGLRPEHVVLLLTDEGNDQIGTMHAAIRHYRTQGFRIALGGIGTSRASMERMLELKPDYARIGGDWIPAGTRDPAGESLLQAIAALARKEKIVLIANDLKRENQVRPLLSSGIGYGQGEWLGKPEETPMSVQPEVTEHIRQEMRRRFRGAAGSLVELSEPALIFQSSSPVSEIARHFESHREANGFVIVEEGKPVGLLMKEKLHQMLAWQFGLPLYWSRPVAKVMDTRPLVVDESTPVHQLSQTAMAREPDKLYDAVIVTKEGEVTGIVSIRALLEWVTNVRMSDAQWANPLTGLPGNEPIRRELIRRIDMGRPFAVLYADLDHFKWYNDQYGFHRGDDVIRYTGETIQTVVRDYCPDDSFVGHIGGDDFIVIIDYGNPVRIAEETLVNFEKGISSFVDQSHGPVMDRMGRTLEGAGLSLSLGLLLCQDTHGWTPEKLAEYSAQLKKKVKAKPGSALESETLEDYAAFAERRGLTLR